MPAQHPAHHTKQISMLCIAAGIHILWIKLMKQAAAAELAVQAHPVSLHHVAQAHFAYFADVRGMC